MFDKSFRLLKENGVVFEQGLSLDEIQYIENLYRIIFPISLRTFLMNKLPVSNGFYNWRDMSKDNIESINQIINTPFQEIFDKADEVYWCEDWGDEPNEEVYLSTVREKLKKAPRLIPVYSHRYIPSVSESNPPVFSIHGVDIVCYGKDLEEYIDVEFGIKKQDSIQFDKVPYIDFWSDIM